MNTQEEKEPYEEFNQGHSSRAGTFFTVALISLGVIVLLVGGCFVAGLISFLYG